MKKHVNPDRPSHLYTTPQIHRLRLLSNANGEIMDRMKVQQPIPNLHASLSMEDSPPTSYQDRVVVWNEPISMRQFVTMEMFIDVIVFYAIGWITISRDYLTLFPDRW